MATRISNLSFCARSRASSRSQSLWGSSRSAIAGNTGLLSPRVRSVASRASFFTRLSCFFVSRSRFRVFFECLWTSTSRRPFFIASDALPASRASSSSESSSSSTGDCSMPRKKWMAVHASLLRSSTHARPTQFTVGAHVQTPRPYKSTTASSATLADLSLPSREASPQWKKRQRWNFFIKACCDPLDSPPPRAQRRTSLTTCVRSSSRSARSRTRRISSKQSSSSSTGSRRPLDRAKTHACTRLRRSSGARPTQRSLSRRQSWGPKRCAAKS
mmetsp:Transcript_32277/g.109710  ORF Transcript_32277/g.109710 Transcript_32277/m.109710 type:complete len:273 (+) Transcript_32277:1334-2152(+)